MRQSWDSTWQQVTEVIAGRSVCHRRGVGAVIVSSDQRVLATGYNGAPAGLELPKGSCLQYCERAITGNDNNSYDNCVDIHAEMNALLYTDRKTREGSTIYINASMCYGCAKVIANSGIAKVCHKVSSIDEFRQPDKVEDFLVRSGLEVKRWT